MLKGLEKNGKQIGRKKGVSPKVFKLSGKKNSIKKRLIIGESINSLAKNYNVTWTTMKNFIIREKLIKYVKSNCA